MSKVEINSAFNSVLLYLHLYQRKKLQTAYKNKIIKRSLNVLFVIGTENSLLLNNIF